MQLIVSVSFSPDISGSAILHHFGLYHERISAQHFVLQSGHEQRLSVAALCHVIELQRRMQFTISSYRIGLHTDGVPRITQFAFYYLSDGLVKVNIYCARSARLYR
jgi:hypothetical protein